MKRKEIVDAIYSCVYNGCESCEFDRSDEFNRTRPESDCREALMCMLAEAEADRTAVLRSLFSGEWVESEALQEATGLTFEECFKTFEFSRTAAWWSVVGETEEERSRNGMKITNRFRLWTRC